MGIGRRVNRFGGPQQVTFKLRRPHVLPICLLQIPVDGSWFGGEPKSPTGDYRRESVEDDLVRYVLSGEPKVATQPREIVEIRSASASDGVSALLGPESMYWINFFLLMRFA